MNILEKYHPDAKAVLVMTAGMATQGLPSVLEQYGYTPHEARREFWRLDDSGSEESGLVFSDDWTEVAIVGSSPENIENVNYVLSRGGWTSVEIKAGDRDIEEALLSTISSLEITDVISLWKDQPEETPTSAGEKIDKTSAVSEAVSLSESGDELRQALQTVESQQRTIREMEETIRTLQGTIENMRKQPSGYQPSAAADLPTPIGQGKLVVFVERYLMQQFNVALKDMDVVHELKSAGYEVKLSIVPC
jgi:hypothetical protein